LDVPPHPQVTKGVIQSHQSPYGIIGQLAYLKCSRYNNNWIHVRRYLRSGHCVLVAVIQLAVKSQRPSCIQIRQRYKTKQSNIHIL